MTNNMFSNNFESVHVHSFYWSLDVYIRIIRYLQNTPRQVYHMKIKKIPNYKIPSKRSKTSLPYEDKKNTQLFGYYDVDWAASPMERHYTSGYYVFIGGHVITWKRKKQNEVESEYSFLFSQLLKFKAMASSTCELEWVKEFPQELNYEIQQMKMIIKQLFTLLLI